MDSSLRVGRDQLRATGSRLVNGELGRSGGAGLVSSRWRWHHCRGWLVRRMGLAPTVGRAKRSRLQTFTGGVTMEWLGQITWISWSDAINFTQMGFFIGVGFTVVRVITGIFGLIFAVLMKAWFG
jgi:hypothetical protein